MTDDTPLDPDLASRFGALDDLDPPDTWPRVAPSGRRSIMVPAAAALLALVGGAWIWMAAANDDGAVDVLDVPGEEVDVDVPVTPDPPTTPGIVGPTCSTIEDPPLVLDGPRSADPEIAEQQDRRASYGFASDEATVEALLAADPPVVPAELEAVYQDLTEGLGLVLTADEVQDMYERQEGPIREQSSAAILAFADAHPDTYAGRWIDQRGGGLFTLAVSGDREAQWAELEPQLPEGHRVVMVPAAHSLVELAALQAEVDAVLADFGFLGSTRVNAVIGLVEVGVADATGVDVAAMEAALADLPACLDGDVQSVAAPSPDPAVPSPFVGVRTHASYIATDEMGTLHVATTQDEADALWTQAEVDGPTPSVDEGARVVLRFTTPHGACPDIFAGLRLVDGAHEIEMTAAGYQGCDAVLIPLTYIVSVDRGPQLPLAAGDVTIRLPERDPFYDAAEVTVTLDAATAPGTPADPTVPDEMDVEPRAVLVAPTPGTAVAELLDDGTPVFVVAHHDGAVTVVDTRVPVAVDRGQFNEGLDAVRRLTSWWGGAGRFLGGGGVWDSYGRALDNGAHADLVRHIAIVDGDQVVVGGPSSQKVTGDPIIDGPAFGPNADPLLPSLVSVADALATPIGTVSQVDAVIVASSDDAARLCDADVSGPIGDHETCTADDPVIDDLVQPSPDGRVWTTWLHGPILVRRTNTGFAEAVAMGGRSSSAR